MNKTREDRGDTTSPLRWACKGRSLRVLQARSRSTRCRGGGRREMREHAGDQRQPSHTDSRRQVRRSGSKSGGWDRRSTFGKQGSVSSGATAAGSMGGRRMVGGGSGEWVRGRQTNRVRSISSSTQVRHSSRGGRRTKVVGGSEEEG